MKRGVFRAALLTSGLGLAACGYTPHYSDPTKNFVLPTINSSVDQIIANEAQQAVAAQRTLAMIKRVQNPGIPVNDPNANAPAELLVHVTVANYTGPVGAYVQAMAQQAGYKYVMPQIPVDSQPNVNLNIENRTIAEALDDAALQVQGVVEIVVNPNAKTMTLRKFVPKGAMVDNPVTNASVEQPGTASSGQTFKSGHRQTMTFGGGSSSSSSHRTRHVWKTEESHS